MVRRAVLDAHPQAPLAVYDRIEAGEWVSDLFKAKPSQKQWAVDIWEMPYKEAVRIVQDRRLGMNMEIFREKQEAELAVYRANRDAALGTEYIMAKEAAKVLGVWEQTLRWWVRCRVPLKYKWFKIGKREVMGFERADVARLAEERVGYTPQKQRLENFKKSPRRFKGAKSGANTKRQADRQTGAGRTSVVLGGA
jgi:hypothetical protein